MIPHVAQCRPGELMDGESWRILDAEWRRVYQCLAIEEILMHWDLSNAAQHIELMNEVVRVADAKAQHGVRIPREEMNLILDDGDWFLEIRLELGTDGIELKVPLDWFRPEMVDVVMVMTS